MGHARHALAALLGLACAGCFLLPDEVHVGGAWLEGDWDSRSGLDARGFDMDGYELSLGATYYTGARGGVGRGRNGGPPRPGAGAPLEALAPFPPREPSPPAHLSPIGLPLAGPSKAPTPGSPSDAPGEDFAPEPPETLGDAIALVLLALGGVITFLGTYGIPQRLAGKLLGAFRGLARLDGDPAEPGDPPTD